jgi:quinol-cytochrome oxidoreductase complex cytochrome b subunit
MLIPKKILRLYKVPIAVFIFLICFGAFHLFKPAFAYQENGAYRPFGVGYKHKTVIPIWSIAIILAIFSYLLVLMGIMYL